MPNQEIKTTLAYNLYKLDEQYKNEENIFKYIDQAQNFYNGKQYPDGNAKNMIRVTMNIIKMCVVTKASKICGTPIYLTFTADNMETDCTALRQFDEYNYNKLDMTSHNYQSAINGLTNGTEIVYMPWDKDDTIYKGIYRGGLNVEHIDPRNFAVANPYINDIQRQKWVMIWEDYDVEAVLDMLEAKSKKEKDEKTHAILGDEDYDTYKKKEIINHKIVKMFTRFFRVDGEVYYMCSTENVDLFAYPHPLSRKISKRVIKSVVEEYQKRVEENKDSGEKTSQYPDYKLDYEDMLMNTNITERFTDKKYRDEKEKFSLYPFAAWIPHKRNRSFFGHSDVQDLIPTQRALNFILSMIAKCAENNAYNKIFAKKGALGDQVITNEPSQVIYDESEFTNSWGIKMAESQPLPNGLLDYGSQLLSMTRVVYGFNEVLNGEISNQDISGYAVQQMIKQANTSIEQQQQLFWRFQEELAAIRLMYYKHYVESAKYTTELSDAEYEGEEQARQILARGVDNGKELLSLQGRDDVDMNEVKKKLHQETHKTRVHEFKNEDIWGVNFDICIDAIQGLADSKLVEQQTWDNLILNNGIQNISPTLLSLYLQAAPNISPRTKAALKNVVKNLEMSENEQLKKQLEELAGKTEQIMMYAKQLEAANGYQSEFLKNLQSEFSQKINAQNKVIGGLTKQLDKYQPQTSEGEVKSNNAKGISGTHVSVS